MNKCRIAIWILGIIFFIFNILTPFFIKWTHVSLQVLFYISFFPLCSIYIFILLIEISIYGKYLRGLKYKIENHICLFTLIFFLFSFFFGIILFINLGRFEKFIKNCPFYLDKLDYDLNFDRRCELYDTNYNSRYSYQYICSYDSSKDFINYKKKLIKEAKSDIIICIKFNNLIDNTIINTFKDVYNKKDKYYCSRTNIPQESDYSFAKAKDCKMAKYKLMSSITFFDFIQYIYPLIYKIIFSKNRRNAFRREIRGRIRNRIDQEPPARNDSIGRAIFRIHNDLINLGRFLNFIRNIVIINNASPSNNSTERSENPGGDIDFIPEKTINIIIENKEEFIIDQNIKNISSDKANKTDSQINSGKINSLDLNSEETIIRNTDFNENNINNQ
jgi:hypothetical protein